MKEIHEAENQVRAVLEDWAKATRQNRNDDVLKNHVPDVVIFDVLPPMKYESADAYRRSWGDWQPETQSEGQFDLENLTVTAGTDLAFAHCFIRCGGTLPDGHSFQDLVRATFCLCKIDGSWKVTHQHISKPFERGGN
ncbi:MAG TPA: nuclear transport factor 2 family protein [Candidatus Acidoferrum sp.]|nr:nuclear transport factor 2 family protein [Candidatus Acidoferrum sp.]